MDKGVHLCEDTFVVYMSVWLWVGEGDTWTHMMEPLLFPLPRITAKSQSMFKQKVEVYYFCFRGEAMPEIIN